MGHPPVGWPAHPRACLRRFRQAGRCPPRQCHHRHRHADRPARPHRQGRARSRKPDPAAARRTPVERLLDPVPQSRLRGKGPGTARRSCPRQPYRPADVRSAQIYLHPGLLSLPQDTRDRPAVDCAAGTPLAGDRIPPGARLLAPQRQASHVPVQEGESQDQPRWHGGAEEASRQSRSRPRAPRRATAEWRRRGRSDGRRGDASDRKAPCKRVCPALPDPPLADGQGIPIAIWA